METYSEPLFCFDITGGQCVEASREQVREQSRGIQTLLSLLPDSKISTRFRPIIVSFCYKKKGVTKMFKNVIPKEMSLDMFSVFDFN